MGVDDLVGTWWDIKNASFSFHSLYLLVDLLYHLCFLLIQISVLNFFFFVDHHFFYCSPEYFSPVKCLPLTVVPYFVIFVHLFQCYFLYFRFVMGEFQLSFAGFLPLEFLEFLLLGFPK